MSKRTILVVAPLLVAGALIGASAAFSSSSSSSSNAAGQDGGATDTDRATSLEAFTTVARVLRHPRCLNCHPSGDVPRVGDDRHLHLMNVQRGPEDHGSPGLHCSTCHQTKNQDVIGIPGAPHWGLAPRSMGWEDLDDHGLAEQLKDLERNGDRSLDDILHHVEHDALVLWGWEPDEGRTPIPISHADFVAAMKAWIDHGAASPTPGTTTY